MIRSLMLYLFALMPSQLVAIDLQVPPPDIDAAAYALQDSDSGRLLVGVNIDQRLEPASLTKIMTAYVVFNELRDQRIALTDTTTISKKAQRRSRGGSRMFLKAGSQANIKDLLKGLIIQSGNDASIALAEHIAGNEETFANLMNEHAKRLGMENSHFMNSSGLSHEEHYTTARDLLKLTQALIKEFPEYYTWFSETEFEYNNIPQPNRNILLKQNIGVDGVKTGYTSSAGYCFIVSAKRKNMRLNAVILKAKTKPQRFQAGRTLLNYGFRFYNTYKLYDKDQPLHTQRIWKGVNKELSLGLKAPIYITIPRGQYKDLSAKIDIDAIITAPITKGSHYGKVHIQLAGKPFVERPLIALSSIDTGAFWQRARDEILQMVSP